MLRRSSALIAAVVFAAGLAVGFGCGYWRYEAAPNRELRQVAANQQEILDRMVRRGDVVAVEPGRITVRITEAQAETGETVTYQTNEYTTVQIGMVFVGSSGEKGDLTKWFQAGDQVNLLAQDGQVTALHRELRAGEAPAEAAPSGPESSE